MRRSKEQPDERRRTAAAKLLATVPLLNTQVQVTEAGDGAVVAVPTRRPKWLVPPISWVMPWRGHRRVRLDAPGLAVLGLCDGQRNVEEVIETFAREHKLSFRESQLAVTQFLRELLRRGIIALAGS